jgi:hypothetical protein
VAGAGAGSSVAAGAQAANTKAKTIVIAKIRDVTFILSSEMLSFTIEWFYGVGIVHPAPFWSTSFVSFFAKVKGLVLFYIVFFMNRSPPFQFSQHYLPHKSHAQQGKLVMLCDMENLAFHLYNS